MRCLHALRSGIPAEQAFALHHLVKISYERGDKYKFESFQGLADGLVERALEVGSLFYHVNWKVSWDLFVDPNDKETLSGEYGTADIIERIQALKPKIVLDTIQPAEFFDEMILINEATLTIRNMVMLNENAIYLADLLPVRDLLCIILHLPDQESVVELKHMALDITEQLTPHMDLSSEDPLYKTLLLQLQLKSLDRGIILTCLRSLARISVNREETNKLTDSTLR